MTTYPPPARAVLRLNAVTTILAGVGMLAGAGPLASALGFTTPSPVAWFATVILVAGCAALVTSMRRGIRRPSVMAFALADLACVGAGLGALVLAPHDMTTAGRAFIAVAVAVVAWFAMAGLRAARKL